MSLARREAATRGVEVVLATRRSRKTKATRRARKARVEISESSRSIGEFLVNALLN